MVDWRASRNLFSHFQKTEPGVFFSFRLLGQNIIVRSSRPRTGNLKQSKKIMNIAERIALQYQNNYSGAAGNDGF